MSQNLSLRSKQGWLAQLGEDAFWLGQNVDRRYLGS